MWRTEPHAYWSYLQCFPEFRIVLVSVRFHLMQWNAQNQNFLPFLFYWLSKKRDQNIGNGFPFQGRLKCLSLNSGLWSAICFCCIGVLSESCWNFSFGVLEDIWTGLLLYRWGCCIGRCLCRFGWWSSSSWEEHESSRFGWQWRRREWIERCWFFPLQVTVGVSSAREGA